MECILSYNGWWGYIQFSLYYSNLKIVDGEEHLYCDCVCICIFCVFAVVYTVCTVLYWISEWRGVDLNIMGGGGHWWIGASGHSAALHRIILINFIPVPSPSLSLSQPFISEPLPSGQIYPTKYYSRNILLFSKLDICVVLRYWQKCSPWDWKSPGPSIIWGFVKVGSVKFRLLRGWEDCGAGARGGCEPQTRHLARWQKLPSGPLRSNWGSKHPQGKFNWLQLYTFEKVKAQKRVKSPHKIIISAEILGLKLQGMFSSFQ